MHIVALAWIYVVGMASIAEALSQQGTVLGAVITFVFWGVLPLGVVLYLIGTPARKKARRRREAAEAEAAAREGVEGAAADVAEAPSPVTALHGTVPDAPAPPRRLR